MFIILLLKHLSEVMWVIFFFVNCNACPRNVRTLLKRGSGECEARE